MSTSAPLSRDPRNSAGSQADCTARLSPTIDSSRIAATRSAAPPHVIFPQAAANLFPSVEPPAPPAARLYSPAARHRWRCDRWHEVPCWLVSMVLHLGLMILLASLVSEVTDKRSRTRHVIRLALKDSFSDDSLQSAERLSPVRLEPTPAPVTPQSKSDRGAAQDEPTQEAAQDKQEPQESAQDKQEPQSDDAAPVETNDSVADDASEQSDDPQLAQEADYLPGSTSSSQPATFEGVQPVLVSAAMRPVSGSGMQAEMSRRARSKSHDDAVERFIQYDIGRLSGEAAVRARRDFEALGPEAIPALVRGLNRSASIRASCPVVVLSNKLQYAVSQSNDRAMIDYALAYTGHNLPARSPHGSRVRSLATQLQRRYGRSRSGGGSRSGSAGSQFDRDFADVMSVSSEPRHKWRSRVQRLYGANAEKLARSVQSRDERERTAGWAALSMRDHPDMSIRHRLAMAKLLIGQFQRGDLQDRRRIHSALEALTTNDGVTGVHPRFQNDRARLARQWHSWWSQYAEASRRRSG